MKIKRSINLCLGILVITAAFSIAGVGQVYGATSDAVNAQNTNIGQTVKVTLDGKQLPFEKPPQNINGRVLVPMRGIFEAMGADVQWDNDLRIAVGKLDKMEVKIPIGSKEVSVGGKQITIDEPAQIIEERTFVPVRVVSEGLGADVTWDQDKATVIIKSKEEMQPVKPEVPTENLEKLGVAFPPFTYYSQFGWGLSRDTEFSLCVMTCWAMLINNQGIPANPVDVYVANDMSSYVVWSKINGKFGVKNKTEIVNPVEITLIGNNENSEEYKAKSVEAIKKQLVDNPQGVMVNFNRGLNKEVHSMIATKVEGDTVYFNDPSAGENVTMEASYIYKRGQGWGNLYSIQTVSKV